MKPSTGPARGAALLLAGLVCLGGCRRSADPSTFSVVLVTLDTTRADRIGAFGGKGGLTPRIDALAAEGTTFQQAISQVPLTLPAHSSILTAQYPARHGVQHNGIFRLADQATTVAEHLKGKGFATSAVIGAFVLNKAFGTAQGFDVYNDVAGDRSHGASDSLYEAQRTADQVNAEVFTWLEHRPAGPFFLWVHYYDPHIPYSPPEGRGRMLRGSGYDREISYLDACLGDLVDRLRREGLLDRTLLAIVGDHGESLGEHLEVTHGMFLYEGAVHVPFLLRAPGLVKAGTTVDHPVELVDVVPTMLDLLGVDPLPGAQGKSLVPRMRGRQSGTGAVAHAETEFPRLEFGWSELSMVRDSRYKYIQAPRPELYDLREDPGEQHNLLAGERERAADLKAALDRWRTETAAEKGETGEAHNAGLGAADLERLRSLGYLGGPGSVAPAGAALPDPKDRVEEGRQITEARDLIDRGRPGDALPVLDRIVGSSPGNHLARSSRVLALVRLGRKAEAEGEAREALAAASADRYAAPALVEKAHRALASTLWMNGKHAEAEREYRLAMDLNRANPSAPSFPGLLTTPEGAEQAGRLVGDVLSRHPDDPMAWAAKFELEYGRKDVAAALGTAARLAELRAGDPDTLVRAGMLARDAGNRPLALRLFEVAGEKAPHDADVLGHLATSRITAGDLQGATRALREVRRLRPKDPRAPFYLGNIALLQDREREARSLYAEALGLDPGYVAPLHNLARWLAEKGRLVEAETVLREAEARRPGFPLTAQLKAQIEARLR